MQNKILIWKMFKIKNVLENCKQFKNKTAFIQKIKLAPKL